MFDKKNRIDREERVFTLRDCLDLFKKKKKTALKIALFLGCFLFVFQLLRPPQYKIGATFKEGGEKEGNGGSFKEIVTGFSSRDESQISVLMKSYPVLKPLIGKMGLQVKISSKKGPFAKLYGRIRDNFLANGGSPLPDPDSFVFQDVSYEGKERLSFFFRFEDRDHFSILSSKGNVEVGGSVGSEVEFSNVRLTLVKVPNHLHYRSTYSVEIFPWTQPIPSLCKKLSILPSKLNKKFFELSFESSDRHRGAQILDQWMNQYLMYLKEEHDEIDQQQIAYLEKRQKQFYDQLSSVFDDYGNHLSENLRERGSLGLKEEIETILPQMREISQKLFNTNIELSRLDEIEKEEKLTCFIGGNSASKALSEIYHKTQLLKQQRDLLSLSLEAKGVPLIGENRREEIQEVRSRKEAVSELLGRFVSNEGVSFSFEFEPEQALGAWAESLNRENEKERRDFSEYLKSYLRVLTLKEKILQERFFHSSDFKSELEGIDLETASELFAEYNKKLDESEVASRHYELLREEIHHPDFEFSSLGSILTDSMSRRLIQKASETLLLLKDEQHRSAKEGERWEEELALQRKILSDHLFQLLKVEELSSSLMREKIGALKEIAHDCINQQLSVLNESASDLIKQQRKALLNEREILIGKIGELRSEASKIPESWRQEKWLELKVEFSSKMMDAITEMVEAKTINHHLYQIQSKPINRPLVPTLAVVPHLYAKASMGAVSGGAGYLFLILLVAIFRGFPSSPDQLKAMGFPFLGELSSFCHGPLSEAPLGADLELLRQMGSFFKKKKESKVIGLIGGKGPDYSYALAENLGRSGRRSLVLRCDFGSNYHLSDQKGLLQFLQGETGELPLQQGRGFNYVSAGGYTSFSNEQIQSLAFQELLEGCKKNYDSLLILVRSSLSSAESIGILDFCDQAIVTVCGESTESLTPFLNWGYHGGDPRVMFITSGPA